MATVNKNAGILAARVAGESPVMDVIAAGIEAKAKSLAAAHRVTGSYIASIGSDRIRGKNGVTDRIVYADDPGAFDIEYGHLTRRGKGVSGPQQWVPGQFILTRAADL